MARHTTKDLTQAKLKELFSYDPLTGVFTRIKDVYRAKKGDTPGTISQDGYLYISISRKKYTAHRLAFLYMDGYFPENEIDHINRVKIDNRWSNLRHVSHVCNMKNVGVSKANKSGVVGVYWSRGKNRWIAYIRVNNKRLYIKSSKSFDEAVLARWKSEVSHNYHDCNSSSSAYLYLKDNGLIDKDTEM